jgi:hypothetical protein
MDLDEEKAVCGTCKDWQGKRECAEGGVIRVSASARGICGRLNKVKPPQGGCDHWQGPQGGGKEDEKGTDSCS